MLSSAEIIALERTYGARNYAPLPVVFRKARGVEVWDPEGRRYLDFLSGVAALNQGHCHPRIVRALVEQADKVTLPSRVFYSETFGPFARQATAYFGFQRILVMNTGVEAVETALKLARKWGYRRKDIPDGEAVVVVCENNFHGRTLTAVSASTSPKAKAGFGPFLPGILAVPFGDAEALGATLKDRRVAAFLVEPIQGEGGVVVPPEGYLKRVRELCTKHDVLFIADEIQTGIGRTGKRLACDHEGVRPDVLLVGKALSGGLLPVSAVLADDPVMLVFEPGDHGSTFGGNALACAVGMAALSVVVDEELAANAEARGEQFREGVRALKSPFVAEVRGRGLLNALELRPEAGRKGMELCLALKERGLLAKDTRDYVIRFAPPLVISETQMEEALGMLRSVLL